MNNYAGWMIMMELKSKKELVCVLEGKRERERVSKHDKYIDIKNRGRETTWYNKINNAR